MTFQEFDKFQADLLAEVVRMRDTKGKEYANSESRFANFDRLAAELGLSNIDIAWVYATKHLDSIRQAIRTKQFTGRAEPIIGRFVDFVTYLTLIAGMIQETVEPPPGVVGKAEIVVSNLEGRICEHCKYRFLPGQEVVFEPYKNIYYHLTCPK